MGRVFVIHTRLIFRELFLGLNTGLLIGTSSGTNYDDEVIDTREEESPNCLSDRKSAIEDGSISGHVHNATYIPECTSDGRYKKVLRNIIFSWATFF